MIPLSMSAIDKIYGFRATLDILGLVFGLNAVAFLIHASRSNWGRRLLKEELDEEESSLL